MQAFADEVLEEQPDQYQRQGCQAQEKAEPPTWRQAPAQQVKHAARDLQQIAPEIKADGQQSAHVHGDIQHQALARILQPLGPADGIETGPGDHQMPRRGNRQELRDALNQGENDEGQESQGLRVPMDGVKSRRRRGPLIAPAHGAR